jgi:hypothetical protein
MPVGTEQRVGDISLGDYGVIANQPRLYEMMFGYFLVNKYKKEDNMHFIISNDMYLQKM